MTPIEAINKAIEGGFPITTIAAALGKHRSTVHLWLRNGISDTIDAKSRDQLYSLVRAVELGYAKGILPLRRRVTVEHKLNALKILMKAGAEQ